MGSKYFQSELEYLREMGREFALTNPATAGLLSERGSDPDVERLLEGFAFLTARIRERVDDAVPSIVHGLTELLLPHYMRTVAATSIVQFAPVIKALRGVHRIARGTKVAATPVAGTSCMFRTAYDVDLLPLIVHDVALDETIGNRPSIRLELVTTEAGRPLLRRPEGLRLQLHGDQGLCSTLMLWLFRHLTGVRVITREDGPVSKFGPDCVKMVGFADDDALLPWPPFAPPGYRYLQEYFTQPAKFLAFDLHTFEHLDVQSDRIEVTFDFERPPELPIKLARDLFRLHCTPVINLFDCSGDPIRRHPLVHENLIRASGFKPRHVEIYSVESVLGIRPGRAERREYHPFFGFAHGHDDPSRAAYFVARPSPSPVDEGIDTYISIITPRDVSPSIEEETLSIELMCTNRSLPSELQVGEICVAARGSSTLAPFKNITSVTPPIRPPMRSEMHWRLISHLAVNRRSLGDPEMLKAVLALYNFQREVSPQTGRANEILISAIRNVESHSATRLMKGAPVTGVKTEVEIDETTVPSIGDAFMFGTVLDEVLATHVSINSFNELHMQLHPSKGGFRWTARNGRQAIV